MTTPEQLKYDQSLDSEALTGPYRDAKPEEEVNPGHSQKVHRFSGNHETLVPIRVYGSGQNQGGES